MTDHSDPQFERKHQFLLDNPAVVITWVSLHYPFTIDQLRTYADILFWRDIVLNEVIQWNTDIIDEFKDECFFQYPKDDDNQYPPNWFLHNSALPWSIEFMERYEDLWDWEEMANYDLLKGELREHFLHRLLPYSFYNVTESRARDEPHQDQQEEEYPFCEYSISAKLESDFRIMDEHPEYAIEFPHQIDEAQVNWYMLSGNDLLTWTVELIDQYLPQWNWTRLSSNETLPWSEELIDRYLIYWNWSALSANPTLPWSFDFIKKYEHLLDWSMRVVNPDDSYSIPDGCMTTNGGIAWDAQMLKEFHHKIEPNFLWYTSKIEWDIDLAILYNSYWPDSQLIGDSKAWNTLFHQFATTEHLIPLLDDILVKQRNGDYKDGH